MADLVTYRAEMSALVEKFQSYGNDSMAYSRDHFEKNKREECCELQGNRLNFFESVKPDHNTTTTVVEVEKRRGTNILILRCGPGGRTVIFLEFDSKRVTDEWQEALCRYTGQTHVPNPAIPRIKSELLPPAVVRRKRDKKARSNFADIVVEQVDSDSEDSEVEVCSETPEEAPLESHREAPPIAPSETPQQAPLEAPPAPPLAHPEGPSAPPARPLAPHSPPGSPSEERVPSFTSETSETDSRHGSLRSRDADLTPTLADLAKNSVEKEFNLSDLQQLKVEDCRGDVIVKDVIPLGQLYVGDKILLRNARGLAMNARELIEHIRTSVDSDSEQDETPPEGLEETLPAPPVTTPETPQEAPLEAPQESPLDGRQVALPALLVTTPETPQEAPLEAPKEAPLEGRPEVPPARPVATPSAPGSPIEERVPSLTIGTNETDDCDDAQNDSGPGRLRSRNVDLSPTLADLAKNSVENEFNLSDLEQLKVRDFTGDVIVKDEFPLRQLHVGDKILLRNARGLAMNARELIEHIRTSIVLTLERGAVCTAREEGNELAINIKGSQTVRLDTVDLIRRACTSHCSLPNAEMPEISNLTITEINNIPVAIGSQPDQIAGSMREALETSGGNLTLHLVPQSLLDALAE